MFSKFRLGSLAAFSLVLVLSFSSQSVLGWGERGHHVVASSAARLVQDLPIDSNSEGKKRNHLTLGLGQFYRERSNLMGHLSNIPDISWKDRQNKKRIAYMNSPNHYFGPERVLGAPGEDFNAFLEKIRALPADYSEFKARWDGKMNMLPGVPQRKRKLQVYEDVGTAPWRTQQLYDLLTSAFACAKSKENRGDSKPSGSYPQIESSFQFPEDALGEESEPPLPSYRCQQNLSRYSDLDAAQIISGVLAHFIGDQAQPYHPTADYDGWMTGNGGIHVYFESLVVQALSTRLNYDVATLARSEEFRREVWEKIGAELEAPNGVARMMLRLAAESQSRKAEVQQIDDRVAILEKSLRLEWGDHPRYHSDEFIPRAVRKPAANSEVLQAFHPIVVERLSVGAFALSQVWLSAWKKGGKPNLSDINAVALSYPLDPGFIWPDYDEDALERSKKVIPQSKEEKVLKLGDREEKETESEATIFDLYGGPVSPETLTVAPQSYLDLISYVQAAPRRLTVTTSDRSRYPSRWWEPVPREGVPDWEILPQDAKPGQVILSKRLEDLGKLSNFSETPFRYRGKTYRSIEGFWQAMKYPEGPNDPRAKHPGVHWEFSRKEVSQMVGFEAKRAGSKASKNMKKIGINYVTFDGRRMAYRTPEKGDHYSLIVDATWAKVRQNPDVRGVLLATGDLVLKSDHRQSPDAPPAWRYYDIYMEIREQLMR